MNRKARRAAERAVATPNTTKVELFKKTKKTAMYEKYESGVTQEFGKMCQDDPRASLHVQTFREERSLRGKSLKKFRRWKYRPRNVIDKEKVDEMHKKCLKIQVKNTQEKVAAMRLEMLGKAKYKGTWREAWDPVTLQQDGSLIPYKISGLPEDNWVDFHLGVYFKFDNDVFMPVFTKE